MINRPAIPEGFFDATAKLKSIKDITLQVKVSQFLDSEEVKSALTTLQEPVKYSSGGRYGYTYLRLELENLFDQWLLNVGKGRGRKLPFTVDLQIK